MSNFWTNPDVLRYTCRRYLENLLEEQKILAFYVHGLPVCNNLLNQEIGGISKIISQLDFNISTGLQFGSANFSSLLNIMPKIAAINLGRLDGNPGWNLLQGFGGPQGPPIDHWNAVAASSGTLLTKKLLRVDVPVDRYPNFNIVGRLLGPRGNSLKRIEALTGCRLYINGRGSMKDPNKEERLRRLGCRHLYEPLHVLIEAESLANEVDARLRHAQEIVFEVLKPVSNSQDLYKRKQLSELAMLNSPLKEKSSLPSSRSSTCGSGAMKCVTTAHK